MCADLDHQVGASILRRMVYNYLSDIAACNVQFSAYKLGAEVNQSEGAKVWARSVVGDCIAMSNKLYTPIGVVNTDDIIWLKDPYRLCKVRLSMRALRASRCYDYYVVVDLFKQKSTGIWSDTIDCTIVVHAESVFGVCTYVIIGGTVFV